VQSFLRKRGLTLSDEKTVIKHITDGFDFLQHIRHFSGITAPAIVGYNADIKRCEQGQQFMEGFICPWPERISQNTTCFGAVCIPEPVLTGCIADKTPLLIELANKRHIGMRDRR
jgi:hypothetical protein